MIIYEVIFREITEQKVFGSVVKTRGQQESAYFSNKVKAKSFVAKNKSDLMSVDIIRHEFAGSKTGVLKFLNRNGIG